MSSKLVTIRLLVISILSGQKTYHLKHGVTMSLNLALRELLLVLCSRTLESSRYNFPMERNSLSPQNKLKLLVFSQKRKISM